MLAHLRLSVVALPSLRRTSDNQLTVNPTQIREMRANDSNDIMLYPRALCSTCDLSTAFTWCFLTVYPCVL